METKTTLWVGEDYFFAREALLWRLQVETQQEAVWVGKGRVRWSVLSILEITGVKFKLRRNKRQQII